MQHALRKHASSPSPNRKSRRFDMKVEEIGSLYPAERDDPQQAKISDNRWLPPWICSQHESANTLLSSVTRIFQLTGYSCVPICLDYRDREQCALHPQHVITSTTRSHYAAGSRSCSPLPMPRFRFVAPSVAKKNSNSRPVWMRYIPFYSRTVPVGAHICGRSARTPSRSWRANQGHRRIRLLFVALQRARRLLTPSYAQTF